jgi:hypothetical protein
MRIGIEYEIQRIDSLAEVTEHPTVPMALRIRPSHRRYFERICERAQDLRPLGAPVAVVQEVDYFLPDRIAPRLSLWQRAKLFYRALKTPEVSG